VKIRYKYNTLEDFLISRRLSVDAELEDGGGAHFPVKGIELQATVLFADISSFSERTADMSATETLIFVNNFFSWITVEAIKDQPCIVDKYIGDEVMLLFSQEFGSDDPFVDALQAARRMSQHDALSFRPHVGIASGLVIAGYVGTPVKYSASLFGTPVTLASRCAGVPPPDDSYRPETYDDPERGAIELPQKWQLCEPRQVDLRNIGKRTIRQIGNKAHYHPQVSAEEMARNGLNVIQRSSQYYRTEGKG
jgi:hypothetical protein